MSLCHEGLCSPCEGMESVLWSCLFPPLVFITSYILSIHEHILFLDIRLQKQEGKMCFPRSRWLKGLHSYKDLPTRGFTGEDAQIMTCRIKKKKLQKSAAHETKKKKAFKNVTIPKPYAFQDPNKKPLKLWEDKDHWAGILVVVLQQGNKRSQWRLPSKM